MSDSEEENFCFFGKPLEPYDEDAFPKKKPISVEDQIATDSQGRRRFHGAFTGGFSAGFYNTVGSLEGWLPSEFKSTRQDKAQNRAQRPEDFMDDEDLSEFGIAPQTIRATTDYSTSKKRKKQVFSDGPIPGEPVLHSLLTSGNETIGYLLLKNIGLKNKTPADVIDLTTNEKMYGCEMPKTFEISRDDDVHQYIIPDIYKEYFQKPKDNSFGLGYIGLDKSHINLFKSSKLVLKGMDHKKISITGQAFGVGAFEEDDEDIYVKDDMTKYDFELTSEKVSKKDSLRKKETVFFDDFILAKISLPSKEIFLPPTIPHSFTGKHKVKKSRFEPLPDTPQPERKNMNPDIRGSYLGEASSQSNLSTIGTTQTPPKIEEPKQANTAPNIKQEVLETTTAYSLSSSSGLVFDRFVSASKVEDHSNILEPVERTETTHGTQEMRDAARMKMFGPLTRISSDWQPSSLLCKRFNVPEPHMDELSLQKNRKRTKNLIFEYEKYSDATLMDFKPGLSTNEEPQQEAQDPVENTLTEITSETETSTLILEVSRQQPEQDSHETESKDITEKIDLNKNVDLFKAVFLSSSESEGEDETEQDKTEKNIELKSSVLSDSLLPKIKPLKEGILSNMDFSMFEIPTDHNKIEENKNNLDSNDSDTLSYGPALPVKINLSTQKALEKTSTQLIDGDSDEWVEKSDETRNKNHKKKNKSKKSSHKKKHKHRNRS